MFVSGSIKWHLNVGIISIPGGSVQSGPNPGWEEGLEGWSTDTGWPVQLDISKPNNELKAAETDSQWWHKPPIWCSVDIKIIASVLSCSPLWRYACLMENLTASSLKFQLLVSENPSYYVHFRSLLTIHSLQRLWPLSYKKTGPQNIGWNIEWMLQI